MSDKQDNKSSTEKSNKGVELEIYSTQSEQKTAPKKQVRKRKPKKQDKPVETKEAKEDSVKVNKDEGNKKVDKPKKQVRKRKPRQKTNPDDKAKTDALQNIEQGNIEQGNSEQGNFEQGNSEEEKGNETEEDEELLDFKLEINKYIYQLIKREMRMIGLRTIKECLKNVKDKDKYKDKDLDEIEKQLVEKLSDFIPQ